MSTNQILKVSLLVFLMLIGLSALFTVRQGHAIAHAVEENIIKFEKAVVEVAVHVNPADDPGA